jgi:imidazoleglycerol-phosphate dehydratase
MILMRNGMVERKTAETDIRLKLELDGKGSANVKTGVGFFDHMLVSFAKHAQFDLDLRCEGDLCVDAHHTVEDCGIALGQAFAEAIGDKAGIARYATQFVPMDEALIMASLDVSGRAYLAYHVEFAVSRTGDFDAQLAEEFFRAFAMNAGVTLHINLMYGINTHHIIEAAFKAVARAARGAVAGSGCEGVMSAKGVL